MIVEAEKPQGPGEMIVRASSAVKLPTTSLWVHFLGEQTLHPQVPLTSIAQLSSLQAAVGIRNHADRPILTVMTNRCFSLNPPPQTHGPGLSSLILSDVHSVHPQQRLAEQISTFP